jgi:hypothetical protein
VEHGDDHDDERRAPDRQAGDATDLVTHVGEEVDRARTEVFRAYVRARERARELGDPDGRHDPVE